jgi:hypothetical protein
MNWYIKKHCGGLLGTLVRKSGIVMALAEGSKGLKSPQKSGCVYM